jgi:2-C-methyl-D-erythritol 4-phosphate cytidylyltransferase
LKTWCAPLPRDVGVVIVAAGRGTRFGEPVPKQYQLLGGVPVLLHALRPFAAHPGIDHIALVLPPDDVQAPARWLEALRGDRVALVAGGGERRASVRAGLRALPEACTVVLVHDGARPFATTAMIDAGIDAVRAGHSAVPALPVADTLKRADDYGRVLSTVSRQGLWHAQTPQAFPRQVLERAHAAADAGDGAVSDDAMLVERLGEPVELLPGSPRNIKITTAHDLALATWYLAAS